MASSTEPTTTSIARFRAGDEIFSEGAPAERLFIINAGSVRIYRQVFRERVLVETLGRGNVCGDIAFAADTFYPVSAVAADDVEVVVVPRDAINAVLLSNPSVVERMASRLAARLTYAHFRIAACAIRDLVGRVMLQLRHEAERAAGLDGTAFVLIPWDVAEALGAERSRVDAALRQLATDGVIELDAGGRFRIPAIEDFDRRLSYLELKDRFES